jgi:hypothetical protein
MMRDDDNPPDLRPPVPSLPPDDRIKREALHFALAVIVVVVSLLSNKWEIPHSPDMSTVVMVVLGVNAALRRAEGKRD